MFLDPLAREVLHSEEQVKWFLEDGADPSIYLGNGRYTKILQIFGQIFSELPIDLLEISPSAEQDSKRFSNSLRLRGFNTNLPTSQFFETKTLATCS